jgi:protocatechuate 3,4-dioxygenase beta subunit
LEKMNSIINRIAMLLMMAVMAGCGGSGAFTQSSNTSGVSGTTTTTANSVSLSTTQTSVKSDNSDSATVTATVLDANNAAVAGVTVAFSASGGQLSAASATTDALGQATVVFSAGTTDPSNRTATVTATVAGVSPVQIPIIVKGSTVTISAIPSLTIGGAAGADQATFTVTAKDASGAPIYNTPITLSVAGSGATPGAATLTPTSATTDPSGQVSASITATSTGIVTVTVTGLGATATQNVTIAAGTAAFAITSPASSPATLSTNTDLTVTVNAPSQANVTFTSTLGTWDGGTSSLVTKQVSGGVVSAVLNSTTGGTATVQAIDPLDPTTYATLTVLISAPSTAAAQIDLQSDVGVLAPSTGGTQNQATFTATVRSDVASGSALVAGAPVAFTLSNTTGGGETILPAYGITDSTGVVTATFTSGSLSSDSTGVQVTATVYNSSSAAIASASKNIIINQKAGSVVIGAGTTVGEPVPGGATYYLPMSVVVADSNGNPVKNATVTLSAWPAYYRTGTWVMVGSACVANVTATFDNEDINRNLIFDAGEDVPYLKGPYPVSSQGFTISDTSAQDSNGQEKFTVDGSIEGGPSGLITFVSDGVLTPGNSAGGTLPATVTTDANGLANFDLYYAKEYSIWIRDEIKATTLALGTETTGVLTMTLPALKKDADNCLLAPSPFNPKSPAP